MRGKQIICQVSKTSQGHLQAGKDLLTRLWTEEEGQSTTEYILILGIVVMIALKFKSTVNELIDEASTKLKGEVTRALDPN